MRIFVDTDVRMRAAINLRAIRNGVKPKDMLLELLEHEFAKELKEMDKYPVSRDVPDDDDE